MNALSLPFLRPFAGFGPLVLRVLIGLIMAMHGWQKFQGVDGVAGFFGSLGIPAPAVMAWVVTIVELVGGICLILGLLTRLWAALAAIVMLTVFFTAKAGAPLVNMSGEPGPALELEAAILAGAVALLLIGPGKLALDAMLGIDRG